MIRSMKIFRLMLAAAALPFAFIPAPVAVAATVTFSDANCTSFTFDSVAQTLTCVSGTPPAAGAPTGCTLTASPNSLAIGGGLVALTAQCATGSPLTGFNWTGPGVTASTTANSQSVNVTASAQFSVTPRNAIGSGNTATASVSVATPPPVGAISCAGFNSTKVIDAVFPANGGATTRLYTYNNVYSSGSPGWGSRDAIIVRFTAPAAGDAYLSIALAATGGIVTRTMNLSANSCEFTRAASNIYYLESGSLSMPFSSGPSQYVRTVLTPGQTYYLNMANLDAGNWSCPDSTCDAVILLQNPNP
jgi:hypothetical protein